MRRARYSMREREREEDQSQRQGRKPCCREETDRAKRETHTGNREKVQYGNKRGKKTRSM
uniref:Jlp4 n=1 Tax=Toxoplasma gondii TaxID=5811 RepID=Q86LL5_TOXGO|nr:jlp4 [Toxoplasma gondii]